MAMCGLPVDVFTWTLYWGTVDSFIKHAGHSVGSTKLPFVLFTWEQLNSVMAPWGLLLGGATTAEHDWHHEKFTTNYSLSFTYLDKLLGSFHPGRKPGEALEATKSDDKAMSDTSGQIGAVDEDGNPISAEAAKAAQAAAKPAATAQYTNLIEVRATLGPAAQAPANLLPAPLLPAPVLPAPPPPPLSRALHRVALAIALPRRPWKLLTPRTLLCRLPHPLPRSRRRRTGLCRARPSMHTRRTATSCATSFASSRT